MTGARGEKFVTESEVGNTMTVYIEHREFDAHRVERWRTDSTHDLVILDVCTKM